METDYLWNRMYEIDYEFWVLNMLDKVIKEHLIDCMTEEKKMVELQEDDRSKIDIKVMQQMIIIL